MAGLIHGAGQTNRHTCVGSKSDKLIRGDENRSQINTGVSRTHWEVRGDAMRRILVVDDDPHICRGWLKRCGFRVSIADGAPIGLASLDTTRFDRMIVDIFRPNMDGFESIRVFHNHAPTVPLSVISGSAFSGPELSGPDFLRMAMKLGATGCLREPFRPTTPLSVIDECLSDAEPHRRHVATSNAVTNVRSEPQRRMKSSDRSRDEALAG
jgi:CheY-like chemotaxis protein